MLHNSRCARVRAARRAPRARQAVMRARRGAYARIMDVALKVAGAPEGVYAHTRGAARRAWKAGKGKARAGRWHGWRAVKKRTQKAKRVRKNQSVAVRRARQAAHAKKTLLILLGKYAGIFESEPIQPCPTITISNRSFQPNRQNPNRPNHSLLFHFPSFAFILCCVGGAVTYASIATIHIHATYST